MIIDDFSLISLTLISICWIVFFTQVFLFYYQLKMADFIRKDKEFNNLFFASLVVTCIFDIIVLTVVGLFT